MSAAEVRSHFEKVRPRLRTLNQAFASRLDAAVLDGLTRLDDLPRSDSFWAKTNGLATIYTLDRFCDRILAKDQGDVRALWTKLGLSNLEMRQRLRHERVA